MDGLPALSGEVVLELMVPTLLLSFPLVLASLFPHLFLLVVQVLQGSFIIAPRLTRDSFFLYLAFELLIVPLLLCRSLLRIALMLAPPFTHAPTARSFLLLSP